ncbi:MAG: class I SAM-dependent methyltransferase [Bacteroidota bacterium]
MSEPVYNRIGITYNQTRQADPYLVERLYALLVPEPGKQYLDIGCGTGNYTLELHNMGVNLLGVDPSEEMLSKAKSKAPTLSWTQASAEAIPFPDAHFDGAVATLTLHHWTDLERGMEEVYRVVSKGKWVILTGFPSQMDNYWLCAYFPQMMKDSNAFMHTEAQLLGAMKGAGWTNLEIEPYSVQSDLQDLFLYSGKYHPERYFDENFRNGISSFRLKANEQELESGLKQLRKDLDSGKWEEVVGQFDVEAGDYAFVVGEKI